ncbi:gliding motility-associated lipoprotein GldH [Hymenobacter gelipurpurascens]|uniref:Gliding motility-associated lipoprotein GldH n=1 Tax=Hymenobacter gelipurpurascens TaxID=89968 RepID=A0A212UAZ3_9BACT|nr:gliding motility lipoprotein GldH [Hymenobacter gelipurpurascens]SNC75251.1 gliding motility-associated lipoprotein GldH [Hymenobacter gelipurpurascens]
MRAVFRFLPVAGLLGLLLTACDSGQVYEKNTDLKSPSGEAYVWAVQEKPTFEFDIPDTTQRYDVYFNVRNASAYEYYNLYVKHTLTGPDGKPISRLLHEMLLMDPKTGEPRGQGTGDIYDHQFLALPNQHFSQTGTYKIMLEQYMRQDQLPGIMAVGVRVSKHEGASK